MLNSKRIGRLFRSYNYSTKRMKRLCDDGYIKILGYLPNREHVYTITNKGCRVIGMDYVKNRKGVSFHALACADVYFYLKSKLDCFEVEVDFGRDFRSDALMKLNDRWVLVEVDLSNRRFGEKVKRWEDFYMSGKYKGYFDIFPPILIVSTNVNRVMAEIDGIKSVELNYSYKDYGEIVGWDCRY